MTGGAAGPWRQLVDSVRADHAALRDHDERYRGDDRRRGRLATDFVVRIGFQMMVAYRAMRFCRALGLPLAPQAMSRLIRHLYGADIHWEADFEPGVTLVHGMGLCISRAAHVRSGAILFQNVTLGESIHPETRVVGAPTLERDVHVGPGATVLGPVNVGAGSKIAAGCVVSRSLPPGSIVQGAAPSVRTRPSGQPRGLSGAATAGSRRR